MLWHSGVFSRLALSEDRGAPPPASVTTRGACTVGSGATEWELTRPLSLVEIDLGQGQSHNTLSKPRPLARTVWNHLRKRRRPLPETKWVPPFARDEALRAGHVSAPSEPAISIRVVISTYFVLADAFLVRRLGFAGL